MARRDYVRLLEVEPRLGARLRGQELADARRVAVAPVATLSVGHWDADELRRRLGGCEAFGAMVADGLVAHDLALDGRVATHLLGRGDILAPGVWPCRRLPAERIFNVAEPTRLALLDETFLPVAQRWPSIAGALLVQAERQSERVAMHQLISQIPRADQRIVALLWHLADRWGRVEDVGVVVPLAMGHEAISRLVGGRRPTVSTALGRLAERKLVTRLANGTWLLAPESRALLDGSRVPAPTPEVRLLGVKDCEDPQAEPTDSVEAGHAAMG